MKTLLKLMSLAIFVVIFSLGCKKTAIDETATEKVSKAAFDAAAAKEWYYGVFKKSAEWKNSPEVGKKLPYWNGGGTYRKVGNMEIVEFPMLKESLKYNLHFLASDVVTDAEKSRLGSASLSKISFIKSADGKIHVRELDFIPFLEYAKKRSYDLSDMKIGSSTFDFTGRIVTKTWGGKILSDRRWKEGKNYGEVIYSRTGMPSYGRRVCDWVVPTTCVIVGENTQTGTGKSSSQSSDNTTPPCPEVWDCWDEPDPEPDPDPNPDPDPCYGYGSQEECDCALYGVGCDGPPPPPPPSPTTCDECGNITEAQAEAQLNEITSSCNNTVGTPTIGAASAPDANGVITKPWAGNGCGYTFTRLGFWTSNFSAKYLGTLFKENASTPWKFQEFHFNNVTMDGGQLPPCFDVEISSNIQGGIIENGLRAQGVGSFTLIFKVTCSAFQAPGKDRAMLQTLGGLEKFYPQ